MLKNITNHRLVLVVVIFALIAVSGLFIYSQKSKNDKVVNGGTVTKSGEMLYNENIIPEWVTYTNPSIGYDIEYPKNILPFVGFGDGPTFTFFYKSTLEGNPHFLVSVFSSQGMSVPEWNKTFLTKTLKKITISGVDVDAYIITDSGYPDTTNLQLVKNGVLYSVGFGGLSPAVIDHIINSFHINFVPKSL